VRSVTSSFLNKWFIGVLTVPGERLITEAISSFASPLVVQDIRLAFGQLLLAATVCKLCSDLRRDLAIAMMGRTDNHNQVFYRSVFEKMSLSWVSGQSLPVSVFGATRVFQMNIVRVQTSLEWIFSLLTEAF
jgi:hypothetical protein